MAQHQRVRGTRDLLPAENKAFRFIDQKALEIALRYGYGEIETPIFESTDVFHRTLGETSDVVHKETYTFQDRGGDSITLRPEGTAGVARAFVSEGMAQNLPLRFYYSGPMFRYERPQKGRYRQFQQLGVECLGIEHPLADVELLMLGWDLLKELGLTKDTQLEINTLGDTESRAKYRDQLVAYLSKFRGELSPDSQMRLEKNPMRILDSKNPKDQEIVKGAPSLEGSLNETSRKFFDSVLGALKTSGIPFVVNPQLVRGLDYYCHTVFEFTTQKLGAQGTVLAGGRYDGLIELMGGPKTPGVGWAAGIDRLADLLAPETLPADGLLVALVPADSSGEGYSVALAHELRQNGLRTEIFYSGNVGKKMKKADAAGASFAIIIGETETQKNELSVKNLKTGEQVAVPRGQVVGHLKK